MHVVLALLLQAAPQAPQPDLQDILQEMFARARRDAARQVAGARWTKSRIDEDITDPRSTVDPSRVKVEHRERYRVWGDGTMVRQLKVWRDGKDVSESAQPLPLFIDGDFLQQFEYALGMPARVPCDDHECWRIAFTPKPDAGPRDGDLDQVLLGSAAGTLLVNCEDYGIVRADAHTLQPYNSLVFDVYWFSVSLTQVPVDGTMVTATIEMSFAYKKFWGGRKTKRRFYEYTDVTLPPSK